MRCRCGSNRFHVIYRTVAVGTVVVPDDQASSPAIGYGGPVEVDASELRADALDRVECALCGVGLCPTDAAAHRFRDDEGNVIAEQPALHAVADVHYRWTQADIAWATPG